MRRIVGITLSAIVVAVLAAGPSTAATPAKGTLTAATPKVTWTGTHDVSSPLPYELQCRTGCESFRLAVEPIDGQVVKVKIAVPENTDFDLHIYGPDGAFVVSGSGGFVGEDEVAVIKRPKKGTYDVRIQPYLVLPGSIYKAVAAFEAAKK